MVFCPLSIADCTKCTNTLVYRAWIKFDLYHGPKVLNMHSKLSWVNYFELFSNICDFICYDVCTIKYKWQMSHKWANSKFSILILKGRKISYPFVICYLRLSFFKSDWTFAGQFLICCQNCHFIWQGSLCGVEWYN